VYTEAPEQLLERSGSRAVYLSKAAVFGAVAGADEFLRLGAGLPFGVRVALGGGVGFVAQLLGMIKRN
jgi:hypothetical protein